MTEYSFEKISLKGRELTDFLSALEVASKSSHPVRSRFEYRQDAHCDPNSSTSVMSAWLCFYKKDEKLTRDTEPLFMLPFNSLGNHVELLYNVNALDINRLHEAWDSPIWRPQKVEHSEPRAMFYHDNPNLNHRTYAVAPYKQSTLERKISGAFLFMRGLLSQK